MEATFFRRHAFLKDALGILIFIICVLVGTLLINTYIFRSFNVLGPSMESTLYTGDRLIINRLPVTLAQLERRCPGCSQHDLDDHEEIHRAQADLERQLAAIHAGVQQGKNMAGAGAEFYLAFTEFHGEYLEHTAEEERVTQPMLWQYFTDEELAAHRREIMARNPPQTLLTWFEFVIPAQSHGERVGLLSGFKKMAPAAFFGEGMGVIEKVLAPAEFRRLEAALGGVPQA